MTLMGTETRNLSKDLPGKTRIAPTPSGYLHAGNLLNFVLTQYVAQHLELDIHLRIDDMDANRVRPEYLDDIFRILNWLGISCSSGPQSSADQFRQSQTLRTNVYWEILEALLASCDDFFICSCSRTTMYEGKCVRDCSHQNITFDLNSGTSSVRFRTQSQDVTIWSKYFPSYHWVNVVEDYTNGITHIVRGKDLQPSTLIHQVLSHHLASALGTPIQAIKYAHHDLLVDNQGNKLSKSQGTSKLELSQGFLKEIHDLAHANLTDVLRQLEIPSTTL